MCVCVLVTWFSVESYVWGMYNENLSFDVYFSLYFARYFMAFDVIIVTLAETRIPKIKGAIGGENNRRLYIAF